MSESTADETDEPTPSLTSVDVEALADWCDATGNEADSDEATEATRTVADKENGGWLLRVAARLCEDEPNCLRSLRLSELDYLTLVIAVDEAECLRGRDLAKEPVIDSVRAARDLTKSIVGYANDRQEAARELLNRSTPNDRGHTPPQVPERGHLNEKAIDEIEAWAVNTSAEQMIEAQPGLWLIYDTVA